MSKVAVSAHLKAHPLDYVIWEGNTFCFKQPTVYSPFLLCLCICNNICVLVISATLGFLCKITCKFSNISLE